jgi:hypothetical protein
VAQAVLQMCHAGGVGGTSSGKSVTNVSRGWYLWHWQCYECVTRVVIYDTARIRSPCRRDSWFTVETMNSQTRQRLQG